MILDYLETPPEDREPLKYITEQSIKIVYDLLPAFFPQSTFLQEVREIKAKKDEEEKEKAEIARMVRERLTEFFRSNPDINSRVLYDFLGLIYRRELSV